MPELQIRAKGENPPAREDPVEAVYTVWTPFFGSVPALGRGFQGRVTAKAGGSGRLAPRGRRPHSSSSG